MQKYKVKYPLRIGTRGSKLAVAQAIEVKNKLLETFAELNQDQIEIVKIVTTGDKIQDRHLAKIGGKGLFTKEIEEALFAGSIDIAVHSMKDIPDTLPDGLIIDCILEREDPRDAFISYKAGTFRELPKGATIGTSSVRRQSQLLRIRSDLKVSPFRGNVQTRIEKLKRGDVDATFLAVAGLKRINMEDAITSVVELEDMLPAVSQGAIGIECKQNNEDVINMLSFINHRESNIRIKAERGFLKTLGGSCATPIAGLAGLMGDNSLKLRGLVASSDGKEIYKVERIGLFSDAEKIGMDAGEEILKNAGHLLCEG